MSGTVAAHMLLTLLGPGELRPQSPSPDSRYVLRADAEYVTGYPYVPRGRHDQPLPVRGDVYLGLDALRFRYCSEKPEGPPDPLAEGLAAWVDKNRCGGRCAAKSCLEVRIPYERMKLLARGRVVGMGGTSEDVQVASAGIGIAGLIASVTTGGTTEKWLIGGTIAAAAAGFGFHEYTLKRANYLSIYFVPPRQSDPTLPCLSNSLPPGPPAAKLGAAEAAKTAGNVFGEANGCHVAVFQIFSSHNYWNISAILYARTGKEFVAQSAEQK